MMLALLVGAFICVPGDVYAQADPFSPDDDPPGEIPTRDPSLDTDPSDAIDMDESSDVGGDSPLSGDTGSMRDINLMVNDIEGDVMMRSDTSGDWTVVQEGMAIEKDQRIVVLEGSSVDLTVPGVSAVELDSGAVMKVNELERRAREEGIFTGSSRTVNDIDLEIEKGKMKTKVRDDEEQENNVTIRFPNAVAGVRGTAFQCESRVGQFTSCGVLNGNVRFSNRADTSRFRNLGPGLSSRIEEGDEEPSDPEPLEPEEEQELQEFEEKADRLLAEEIRLDGLNIDGNNVPRDGEGRFHYEMNYRDAREIQLVLDLFVPTSDTAIDQIVLRRAEQEHVLEDPQAREFTLSPTPPEDGNRQVLNYTIYWEDVDGNRSRSHPFQLTLVHPSSSGALPGGLKEGDIPVQIEEVGSQDYGSIQFPYRLTTEDFAKYKLGEEDDTSILSDQGIVLRGSVDTDSEVGGVAYRFRDGEPWLLARGTDNWSFGLPLEVLQSSGSVEVQVVAWSQDGFMGDAVRAGPFAYESRETAFPVDYETNTSIRISLRSIGRQTVSASDLPYSITSEELGDNQLTVRGTAVADTDIEGFAFRLNGGEWQNMEQPVPEWEIALPKGTTSRDYSLDVLTWTKGKEISEVRRFESIQYEYIESTVPSHYESGDVPVTYDLIETFSVSDAEFPFHLYAGDVSDGITIQGTASADTTIEGVAYSTDGGQNWTRAEGGDNWSFSMPAEETITYDRVQVVAWTVAGVRGDPVALDTIEYDNRKYGTVFRDIFTAEWDDFENKRLDDFLAPFSSSDFQFTDDVTGQELDYSQFDQFIDDFFSGVRNLRTFRNISRVLSGESGGEIIFDLEWRGTADDPDRPFLVKGEDVSQQFNRRPDGQFEIVSLEDLPPILYLFNKRDIRIDDLGSIFVKTLETSSSQDGDVIYHAITPDLAVNTISIGGHVSDGGIQEISGDFSTTRDIPKISSGYLDDEVIEEGRLYAVNIRSQSGDPATALIKVIDIRSSFVEVQIISAQSFPGQSEEPFVQYRGVVPFDS